MLISREAHEDCMRQSLHRGACLRKARWFCETYCQMVGHADTGKCATHCTDDEALAAPPPGPGRKVCRPSGRCEMEYDDPPGEDEHEHEHEQLRIRYRPNIPLLVHRNVYGRGWKFNALPIHEYQYGSITGTSIDSVWAQGDTLEVVRKRMT